MIYVENLLLFPDSVSLFCNNNNYYVIVEIKI